jgi:hypothetical protein
VTNGTSSLRPAERSVQPGLESVIRWSAERAAAGHCSRQPSAAGFTHLHRPLRGVFRCQRTSLHVDAALRPKTVQVLIEHPAYMVPA